MGVLVLFFLASIVGAIFPFFHRGAIPRKVYITATVVMFIAIVASIPRVNKSIAMNTASPPSAVTAEEAAQVSNLFNQVAAATKPCTEAGNNIDESSIAAMRSSAVNASQACADASQALSAIDVKPATFKPIVDDCAVAFDQKSNAYAAMRDATETLDQHDVSVGNEAMREVARFVCTASRVR